MPKYKIYMEQTIAENRIVYVEAPTEDAAISIVYRGNGEGAKIVGDSGWKYVDIAGGDEDTIEIVS